MGSALCALPLRIARFLTPYLAPCKMLGTGGEVAPWFSGTWGLHLLEGACAPVQVLGAGAASGVLVALPQRLPCMEGCLSNVCCERQRGHG